MTLHSAGPRRTKTWLVWTCLYLATMASVGGSMVWTRQRLLSQYSTPQAQQAWDTWRRDVQRQSQPHAPVQRRVPESDRPPVLILFSEHFAACLLLALILSSALFFTFAFMIQGVMRPRDH